MELTQAFTNFDLDGNGFIDIEEIKTILRRSNIPFIDEKVEAAIKNLDDDGNGYLDLEEFIDFMCIMNPMSKE